MMNRTVRFGLLVILLTASCCAATWFWGIRPLREPPRGLSQVSTTESDLIKSRYPIHLVNPAWLRTDKDQMITGVWIFAELKARLAVILFLWFAGLLLVYAWTTRELPANNALLPAGAGGAGNMSKKEGGTSAPAAER